MRRKWWILIILVLIGIGIGIYFCQPHYVIVQESRSISIIAGVNNDFVMSPAKIKITNLVWGFPLTIPVKIINGVGDTDYKVSLQDPIPFDKGYVKDDKKDYIVIWDKSSVNVKSNSTEVVNIRIKKVSLNAKSHTEEGIAIGQQAGEGITVVRTYIFEILNK